MISKKVAYGIKNYPKYFIGYIDNDDVTRPVLLKLRQMIGYLKEFYDSMTISFKVDDSKLFKNYCRIWRIISSLLGMELDSEFLHKNKSKNV